jgi:hypothetical protein
MERARWRERFGPPSLFVTTALLIAAAFPAALTVGLPAQASGPSAAGCRAFDGRAAIARAATSVLAAGPSVQDRAQVSAGGELTGRRLDVRASTGVTVAVTLPPESFVAPAAGNVLVYGKSSAGGGSEVHAIDLASGCDLVLAMPAGIVRSARLDAAGTSLFVHAVTGAGRSDAGVTRHDLATGTTSEAVPPLPVSEQFGPTFGTELRWSLDGRSLAVNSCGISHCRTRILDTVTGQLETVDEPGHGPLVGLTAQTLFVLEDLHGLPSALLAVDRQSGVLTRLHDEVFDASLEQAGANALLTFETAAGVREVTE